MHRKSADKNVKMIRIFKYRVFTSASPDVQKSSLMLSRKNQLERNRKLPRSAKFISSLAIKP